MTPEEIKIDPNAGKLGWGSRICSFTPTPGVFGGGGSSPHWRHTGVEPTQGGDEVEAVEGVCRGVPSQYLF